VGQQKHFIQKLPRIDTENGKHGSLEKPA